MFANRILLMRPALYAPIAPQIRAFSLARIALEPVRKTAPPPPPAKGGKAAATTKSTTAAKSAAATKTASAAKATTATAAKRTTSAATKKATLAPAPTTRARLTEKERAARDRAEEREKAARAREREREREKLRKAKEREKALEKKEKAKEREQLRKEREKTKLEISEAIKKPYPPPPKGPKTAYLMFSTDPTVKRDRGEGVTEDAMLASQAWKALSEAERDVYNKKYEKARAAWKEDVAKWVASLNLAQLKAARVNREPGTRDEAAMDTLPKRPGNAYALFLADVTSREDFRNKIDALAQKEGIKDNKELAKKRISLYGRTSADIWKSMSDQEKAVYTTKATQAKAQWDKQFGHLIAAQKEAIAANLS